MTEAIETECVPESDARHGGWLRPFTEAELAEELQYLILQQISDNQL